MSRTLKQILYGFLYCVLFFLIAVTAYKTFVSEPALRQLDVETQTGVSNIRISKNPEILSTQSGKVIALFEITNPNSEYHARFSYEIFVYGESGYVIESVGGNVSILSSQVEYVINNDINTMSQKIARMEVSIKNTDYIDVKNVIIPDVTVSRALETIINGGAVKVSGYVKNQSPVLAENVKLVAILKNAFGDNLFAAQTIISGLMPFEERAFAVLFPQDEIIAKEAGESSAEIFVYQ